MIVNLITLPLRSSLVHFVTCGTSQSPTGDLYVKLKTKAAISFKAYCVGNFVEIDGLWNVPLVALIVSLTNESHTKSMILYLNQNCGYIHSNDFMQQNVVNHRELWDQIGEMFSGMKNVAVRSFDILSSSGRTLNSTVLRECFMGGLGKTAESINSKDKLILSILCLPLRKPYTPTPEQLHVFEKVLDESLSEHVVESAFESGKSATAAAAAFGRVQLQTKSRVALMAQTNAVVEALIKSFNLPQHFDFNVYDTYQVRPLVIQSKNWKFSRNGSNNQFDH
uniref:DNA helicase n=1 Tax=Caenorhabditis tropicalis TaxID=1561998 RepID=A0A1I7U2V0_9PELO